MNKQDNLQIRIENMLQGEGELLLVEYVTGNMSKADYDSKRSLLSSIQDKVESMRSDNLKKDMLQEGE